VSTQWKREVFGPVFKKKKMLLELCAISCVFQVARNWRARTSTCGDEILDFLETLFYMVKRG